MEPPTDGRIEWNNTLSFSYGSTEIKDPSLQEQRELQEHRHGGSLAASNDSQRASPQHFNKIADLRSKSQHLKSENKHLKSEIQQVKDLIKFIKETEDDRRKQLDILLTQV